MRISDWSSDVCSSDLALGLAEPFSFHANPPQTVLRDLYNQAAIFVSASHEEGWGLPPAEAAACGAALVVSSNGGHSDYLTDRETALMFGIGRASGRERVCKSV